MSIEYLYQEGVKACEREPLKVRVDGIHAGEIRRVPGGYQYVPRGAKKCNRGAILSTVAQVQRTLVGLRGDMVEGQDK